MPEIPSPSFLSPDSQKPLATGVQSTLLDSHSDQELAPWLEKAKEYQALPLLKLIQKASVVHGENWPEFDIQRCSLLSIKTGSCPEDCSYCPQSGRYKTDVQKHPLLEPDVVVAKAKQAKESGASRFCMGAAWRTPPGGKQFESVLESVKGVKALGLEVCATLGMVNQDQARALKEAGLDVYNHNIDTSEAHYEKIITTRSFQDRVKTLKTVRQEGLQVCSGGILGLGETADDRLEMLAFLASLQPQPESVPLNLLVAVEGTPLVNQAPVDPFDLVRAVAVTRLLMPKTRIRLSAGRMQLSQEAQALCFVAGANSIFSGEKLLTTPLPGQDFDENLIQKLTHPPLASVDSLQ
jgi:biotin synthase